MQSDHARYVVAAEKQPGRVIRVAYRSLDEAQKAAASLQRSGYRLLEIAPQALPVRSAK